jgi:TolB-like protein
MSHRLSTIRRIASVFLVVSALAAAPAQAAEPQSVCVLYFDNNTGDPAWEPLKKGLADMVVSDLSAVEGIVVVERSRLEDLLGELKMQHSSQFDPATAQKLGKLVGAGYAVTGSITAVAPKIRLDARLIEVKTGKVIVGEKVVGERDRFFELQGNLIALFTKGLGRALPAAESKARLEKVETALAYGQGLDLSDSGDEEQASKALQQVVKAAPRFSLGQKRYLEVLKRLQAAKAKRVESLASNEQLLTEKCDAELKGGHPERLSGDALERYFGYRNLRGNIFLGLLVKIAGADSRVTAAPIPPARTAEAKKLMVAYVENMELLVQELAAVGRQKTPSFPEIDDEDEKAAEELELGSDPERFSFMSPQFVARSTAQFIVMGNADLMASIDAKVKPALGILDPAYIPRAFALLDGALADIAANERDDFKERETTRALTLYGNILLVLGRPAEAIARWQQILDDYPRSTEFKDIETKIRETLEGLE